MENNPFADFGTALNYGPYEIIANMVLAFLLGLVISAVYRYTHKGLSYSQSFTLTIVFVSTIVAVVMMVIGSSLARAFALVGALSIIRFRTVVKDTKDTAFVFLALAVGMAAGTSNYFLGITATIFISSIALILYKLNYGSLYKSEFILRFTNEQSFGSDPYMKIIQDFSKRSNLLHIEPSADDTHLNVTYDIILKADKTAEEFSIELGKLKGTSEITLIASKSDIDY